MKYGRALFNSAVLTSFSAVLTTFIRIVYPLLPLQGQNSRTLPLTAFFFKGVLSIQWNILFVAATLVILPLMIVYFILQKQIISGMLSGSVKG